MLPKHIISAYLNRIKDTVPTPLTKERNFSFSQPLDVNYAARFDNSDQVRRNPECLFNTGAFAYYFMDEVKTGKFVRTGLSFLNSLNFDLKAEVESFKQTNGVVNMNYAAVLYLGGLYYLATKEGEYDENNNLIKGFENIKDYEYYRFFDASKVDDQITKTIDAPDAFKDVKEFDADTVVQRIPINVTADRDLKLGQSTSHDLSAHMSGHGYGVGNAIYEEWTKFIKGSYIDGAVKSDTTNDSTLMLGNYTGQFKSLANTIKPFSSASFAPEMERFNFYATYSVLYNEKDFSGLKIEYNKPKLSEVVMNVLGKLKSQVRAGSPMADLKATVAELLAQNNGFYSQALTGYATLNGNVNYSPKNDDELIGNVIEAAKYEVSLELDATSYGDNDFIISLYPSAGGLFDNGHLYHPDSATSNGQYYYYSLYDSSKSDLNSRLALNLFNRSCRFIWCDANADTNLIQDDLNVVKDSTHRTMDNNQSTQRNAFAFYGLPSEFDDSQIVYGKVSELTIANRPNFRTERIQNLMNAVGIQNLEYFEKEFLKWVDINFKDQFGDKLHFTSTLKAIMLVDQDDFDGIDVDDISYTADQQMQMLLGYSYGVAKPFQNENMSVLLNLFLTNAQFNKTAKIVKYYESLTVGVNNYTTLGMLQTYDKTGNVKYKLLLDRAPFRREILSGWADNSTSYGFILRKLLFGDQDIPTGLKLDPVVASGYELLTSKTILKYYNFRPYWLDVDLNKGVAKDAVLGKDFNKVGVVLEFFNMLNIDVNDEDLLKLLMPIVGTYMSYYVSNPSQSPEERFGNFVRSYFIYPMSTRFPQYFSTYLDAYKKQFDNLTKTDGKDSLIKVIQDDTNVLATYKTATYYNIRALYDNNLYVPKQSFLRQNEDVSYTSEDFLKDPLFYNYTQLGGCETLEAEKVDGQRGKHLYEYVQILDRGNRDVGNDLLANLTWIREYFGVNKGEDGVLTDAAFQLATENTYWSFFSEFAVKHNSLLHPLCSYINLAGTDENGDSYFGTFNTLEHVDSSPAFIIQYIGDLESVLSNADNKQTRFGPDGGKTKHSSFCLDINYNPATKQEVAKIEDAPDDVKSGNVSSFVVDFGAQNQQIFQNLELDTSQFTNTEESIRSYVNLVNNANKQQPASGDLFKILTQRSYSCQVEAMGNVMIQPLSYFYLKNVPLFYGSYWIVNVSHRLEANVIKTHFKGVRQPIAQIPSKNDLMLKILRDNVKVTSQETAQAVADKPKPGATTVTTSEGDVTTTSPGVKTSYKNLPTYTFTRSIVTREYFADKLKAMVTDGKLTKDQAIGVLAIILSEARIDGDKVKGFNNNFGGIQTDSGRWGGPLDKLIIGNVFVRDNRQDDGHGGDMRAFAVFKTPDDFLEFKADSIKKKQLYVGGTPHKVYKKEISNVGDWVYAYYQEWVRGAAETPTEGFKTNHAYIYKRAEKLLG